MSSLTKGFDNCTTPTPTAIITDDVFNVTEWLAPHIPSMSGHSRPHAVKFQADDSERAVLYTKAFANDKVTMIIIRSFEKKRDVLWKSVCVCLSVCPSVNIIRVPHGLAFSSGLCTVTQSVQVLDK